MARTFLSADFLRRAGISVATPSDPEYDTRRATFNGLIDRRPTLVATCSSSADVAAVINHARESGLPVSVRGGGHSVAGHCIGDGAAVVDLSGMRQVRVDATNRLAIAGGGATWLEYDTATQKFGLASTGGTFTDTGIGGLTLGGGIGYLQGTLGFAVDSLVAVEMVTADGEIIRASDRENADLFWAIRGGGGNFGVVTSFEYRVHPVGELYGGVIAYPVADAAKMLRLARDLAAGAADELVLQAVLSTSRETRDEVAAIIVCFQGSVSAGERAIAPLRNTLQPVLDALRPLTYNEMQATSAPFPFGLRHYWKGQFLSEFPDEMVDMAVEEFHRRPVPSLSTLLFEFIEGAPNRVPAPTMAFNHRGARFNVSALGIWEDPAQDTGQIEWARRFAGALTPGSAGASYVNYMNADEPSERVRLAYGDQKFDRLRQIKKRYDPDNIFRFNQNILPAV
ncbi:MAG: FAD-binding oxidoreductase [Chloroflexota bacterium]